MTQEQCRNFDECGNTFPKIEDGVMFHKCEKCKADQIIKNEILQKDGGSRCDQCNQVMTKDHSSCTFDLVKIGEKWYKRNTQYHDVNETCHDCGILNGGVHHYGCDVERCPLCKGQMFCCDCDLISLSKSIVPAMKGWMEKKQ